MSRNGMSVADARFDSLAKSATIGSSRRDVLKIGAGIAGLAAGAIFPARALGAGGNSDCAQFCNSVFPPGPERGRCKSEAAHGRGTCYECGPRQPQPPTRTLCGRVCCQPGESCCAQENRCVSCPSGEVFNPSTCACECPQGTERCGGRCVPRCPTGENRNPTTCQCECPPGSERCNGRCVEECGPNTERNPITCECEPTSPGNQPCRAFVCGGPLCAVVGPGILDLCACFELTDSPGSGLCLGNFFCFEAEPCNTSSDCPSGHTCVTNTCCGLGVQLCAPPCPEPQPDFRSQSNVTPLEEPTAAQLN